MVWVAERRAWALSQILFEVESRKAERRLAFPAWLTSSWISGHVISIAVCYLLCPAVSLLCLQRTHSPPEAQLTINQVGLGLLCMFVLFLLEDFGLPASCFKDYFSSRREKLYEEVSANQTLPCLPKCLCANTSDNVFTCWYILYSALNMLFDVDSWHFYKEKCCFKAVTDST